MSRIIEIGPYHSIDPNNWGENYSERRHLGRMEWEMADYGFRFSFADHIRAVAERFPDVPALRTLDAGCGEGSALADIIDIVNQLGVRIETTGITLDPRHKDWLVALGVDEVVIGSVQSFFETDHRANYYHFILDYVGALSYDHPNGIQGASVVPIYGRVLMPGGSALLYSPPTPPGWLENNGLRIVRGSLGCVLITKLRTELPT